MLTVFYKCKCLKAEVSVEVPDRSPAVDIVFWVQTILGTRVGNDHASRSPYCMETEMEYVKIPYKPEGA